MDPEQPTSNSRPFVSLSDYRPSDEVYRKLLDAAPDAVIVVDDSGRIVLANSQTEHLFGYHRDHLLGQEIEMLIPERYRPAHTGHRQRFFDAPKIRPMGSGLDLFGRRLDGSEFPIEISLSPLPTQNGLLISASIRDVSERKQNEAKIRRIQAHLLSAVESIQGAFAIFDAEDRVVLCNSTYHQLYGSQLSDQIVGKGLEQLLDRALNEGLFDLRTVPKEELRERLMQNHRNPPSALDVRGNDGKTFRIVERRTAESGTVVTVWDITADVEHEDELRAARSAAEAASSAKSEFLASMSHELRTPMNAILGFAQLLQRDKKEPLSERHRERVEYVLKGGEHLLRLIDEVLDLSQIEAGRVIVSPEPIAIEEVLSEVRATLEPIASRNDISIQLGDVAADCARGIADRTRFKQILMNFASNAIKYGRKGGSASFRTSAFGDAIRVTVIDDGIGIPSDKQDKIFQPFQRAGQEAGSIEGTGIGLAITKRLAELMGGSVGFRSQTGQGSEFWIDIPMHHPDPDQANAPRLNVIAESPLTSARADRFLVVYVEDNPSNIAFMLDLMTEFASVELVVAPTAEIGIELIRARRPDVVIMDINLPGMSGFEATRRLREWTETRTIPIVALSAAAMVRDRSRVEGAGFYRYLTKPVQVDELTGVLEELLIKRPRSEPASDPDQE